jgi:beta-lactamase class C
MKILLSFLLIASTIYADNVDMLIEKHREKYSIPGVALAVVQKGKEPKYYFAGKADPRTNKPIRPDSIFEIASITKVFVTTLLALEVERGTVKLSDPAYKYIPGLERSPLQGFKSVTLAELATHTASLQRDPEGLKTREEVIEFLRTWNPAYPLATKYVYSNMGFGLLAYAMSGVTHTQLEPLLKKEIFAPLGMTSTFIEVPNYKRPLLVQGFNKEGQPIPPTPVRILPGGGGLKSTPRDMVQFLLANMGLTGPSTLKVALQFAHQPVFKVSDKMQLALGWQVVNQGDHVIIDKNGGLAGSASYIGFSGDVGVVVLSNKGKSQATVLGRAVLMELLKEAQTKESPAPAKAEPFVR